MVNTGNIVFSFAVWFPPVPTERGAIIRSKLVEKHHVSKVIDVLRSSYDHRRNAKWSQAFVNLHMHHTVAEILRRPRPDLRYSSDVNIARDVTAMSPFLLQTLWLLSDVSKACACLDTSYVVSATIT